MRCLQALPEPFHPRISNALGFSAGSSWPVLLFIVIRLGDSNERVEQRGARAEEGHVPAVDAHGLRAVNWTREDELLHGRKVMTAITVDLRRALLDDILDAQRVQAVLHRQGQQQVQIQARHVHPADEGHVGGGPGPPAVAEEELADVRRVDVRDAGGLRVVVHGQQAPGDVRAAQHDAAATERLRIDGKRTSGCQQLRELQPGEHRLELDERHAPGRGRLRAAVDPARLADRLHYLRELRVLELGQAAPVQTETQGIQGDRVVLATAPHSAVHLRDALGREVEQALEHVLTQVPDLLAEGVRSHPQQVPRLRAFAVVVGHLRHLQRQLPVLLR
mmetsp:Transcript_85977/g.263082  ORF Transcript_85977/g.263082 Transcript_85977/m.263082 type:complete len:334 (+) Transcript_85977:262-1263(+)